MTIRESDMNEFVHLDAFGSGGSFVCLVPGTPQPPEHLVPLARRLATHSRVLLVHLPGYGRSPALAGDYTLEGANDRLRDELRQRDVGRTAFVGFSGGAYRAAELALRGELRCSALVGLGPVFGLDADGAAGCRASADATEAGVDLSTELVPRFLSEHHRAGHPEAVRRAAACFRSTAPEVLAAEWRAFARAPNLVPRLRTLDCPIYLRTGAEDPVAPPESVYEIADGLPQATADVVPGAGHALFEEDLEGTVAAILRVLERVPG